MTHLNIQQGLNISELVSANIIKKLYEAALSVPEPLEGELDAAYMSGRLEVPKSYRSQVLYLAGNINGEPNASGRFADLRIDVTAGYYMLFHDSAVNDVLKNTIGDGVGVLDTLMSAVTTLSDLGFGTTNANITDFREGCLLTGATNLGYGPFSGLTNLTVFGFPPLVTELSNCFASGVRFTNIVVKNWNNFINMRGNLEWFTNGYYLNDLDSSGNLVRIDTLTLPSNCNFVTDRSWRYGLNGVKLEEIIIPSSMTAIAGLALNGIKKITFAPNSTLTTICNNTFFFNVNNPSSIVQLDVANLPLTITTIGTEAFRLCSNVTGVLNLPNLTSLGQYAFYQTGITSITDLGSITLIPNNCFLYSALQSITLPSTCTTIKSRGLSDMTTLTTVNGGSGLTTIENYAFYNDTNLTSIAGLSNVTSIGEAAFQNCHITGTLNLPNIISLGNNAFYNCTGITSIDFTGSAFTTVGRNTFRECSNLTKLVLPTTVTTVGNEWIIGIPRLITVEGTDNIANYGTANLFFRNPIIKNPLKTGFVSDRHSLFKVQGNSAGSGMSLHSLYEPLRKNTPVGIHYPGNQLKITLFWDATTNNANANIGLYYLKDIETFGYMTFYGTTIDNLVINNVTPPTLTTTEDSALMGYTMYQDWGNVIFGPNSVIGTLWVPDSAVSTYQTNPLYSGLTIKGINTKTNGVDYDLPRYATYADWKTAEAAAVAQGGHAPQGLIEAWM